MRVRTRSSSTPGTVPPRSISKPDLKRPVRRLLAIAISTAVVAVSGLPVAMASAAPLEAPPRGMAIAARAVILPHDLLRDLVILECDVVGVGDVQRVAIEECTLTSSRGETLTAPPVGAPGPAAATAAAELLLRGSYTACVTATAQFGPVDPETIQRSQCRTFHSPW
jgi:hypothetical protein